MILFAKKNHRCSTFLNAHAIPANTARKVNEFFGEIDLESRKLSGNSSGQSALRPKFGQRVNQMIDVSI